MLPFLQKKRMSGVIVQQRKPSGSLVDSYTDEGEAPNEIEGCAQDILSAIAAKDVKLLASALEAVFEILESRPHEEAAAAEEGTE